MARIQQLVNFLINYSANAFLGETTIIWQPNLLVYTYLEDQSCNLL